MDSGVGGDAAVERAVSRTDLKLLLRDRFAVVAWSVFLAAALVAAFAGAGWAERHRAALSLHPQATRFEVKAEGNEPYRVWRPLVLAPAPLLDLTVGRTDIEPSTGATGFGARVDRLFANYEIDGPLVLAGGRFDLAFVTIWLAPLLLIALGLSVTGADRDSGVLRLIGASPAGLHRMTLGRAGMRWLLVFGPLALIAAVTAGLSPPAPGKGLRLLAWLAVTGGYLLFWQAAILLASTARLRQEALGGALLLLWALITLVIPAFASATAQALHPPPSRLLLIADARAAEVAARDAAPRLLKSFLVDHPEMAGGGEGGDLARRDQLRSAVLSSRAVEASIRPALARFAAARERQQAVTRTFELASPALLAHRLLADAAGSGEARFAAFRHAAEHYHGTVKARLSDATWRVEKLDAAQVGALGTPRLDEPGLRGVALGVLLLFVAAALLGALAWRRLTSGFAL